MGRCRPRRAGAEAGGAARGDVGGKRIGMASGSSRVRARHVLALDGGATKTRAALFAPDGAELARATVGPCNLYRDAEGGIASLWRGWRACCAAAGLDEGASRARTAVSAGLAGLGAAGTAARVRAAFDGFAAVHLCGDGYAALVGAFGAGPGVLVSVGTGVAGLARGPDGAVREASGWGFPIGDRGGGAWIGFELVARWLHHLDGYPGPGSALWPALAAELGRERAGILAWLRHADAAAFARFAPAVVAAAAPAPALVVTSGATPPGAGAGDAAGTRTADAARAPGDPAADGLLDEAAGHLIRLARVLLPPAGARVALAGGLADALAPRLEAALGPLVRDACPLRGAWRIASGEAPAESG